MAYMLYYRGVVLGVAGGGPTSPKLPPPAKERVVTTTYLYNEVISDKSLSSDKRELLRATFHDIYKCGYEDGSKDERKVAAKRS